MFLIVWQSPSQPETEQLPRDGSFALAEGLLLPAICFFARSPVWKIAQVTVVYIAS